MSNQYIEDLKRARDIVLDDRRTAAAKIANPDGTQEGLARSRDSFIRAQQLLEAIETATEHEQRLTKI